MPLDRQRPVSSAISLFLLGWEIRKLDFCLECQNNHNFPMGPISQGMGLVVGSQRMTVVY